MAHLPTEIHIEIADHLDRAVATSSTDFSCVYGSSTYSPDKTTSDVDLFYVVGEADPSTVNRITRFIKDLHSKHGRDLDEEVPFDNKVLYSPEELALAICFGGYDVSGTTVTVPPVRKTAEFLQSPAIKARLAVNALTTPHVVIGRDLSAYHNYRDGAEDSITLLAIGIDPAANTEFDPESLYTSLTTAPDGTSGEMYLGYKTEYPVVESHLKEVLDNGLGRLSLQGIIHKTTAGYRRDISFDPLAYLHTTMGVQQ